MKSLVFIIVLLLSACQMGTLSVQRFEPDMRYEIHDDNSKRFRFSVSKDMEQEIVQSSRGRYQPEQFARAFDRLLRQQLDDSQFCREGFFVIDRLDHPRSAFIFGECYEGATPSDVARWVAP